MITDSNDKHMAHTFFNGPNSVFAVLAFLVYKASKV